jgi:hypothetical protein
MSKFTIEEARRLAALTFRYLPQHFDSPEEQIEAGKVDRPLLGKEHKLLAVLQAREQRFNDCYKEVETIKALRESDRELPARCAALVAQLSDINRSLTRLDGVSRDELDSIAHWLGSSAAEMHTRIDDLLAWLREAAMDDVDTARRKVGRKKGSIVRLALGEFAKEIRAFLISDEVRMQFGYQVDELDATKLMSPAARLLFEASRYLVPRVDSADIKAVMAAVRRNAEFQEEFHGDTAVDALTE